jgi:hypothetical protein
MPYLSNLEYGSSDADLGCGPECKCGPCSAGLRGLDEWYVKEQEGRPQRPSPQSGQASSRAQPLSGWDRSGIRPGYRGPRRSPGFGPARAISQMPGGANSPDMDQRVVQDALRRGVRNLRQLTAAIFFARHPSQRAEWIQIRDRIARPALQQLAGRNGVFTKRGGVR